MPRKTTGTPDRLFVRDLIEVAACKGCRQAPACAELKTLCARIKVGRVKDGTGIGDGRRGGPCAASANELSDADRAHILTLVNSTEFGIQPSRQIVPTLVNRGDYIASESTMSG